MCAQLEEILRSSLHTTVGGGCSTENCLAAVSMEAAAVGRCSSTSNTGDPGSSNVAEEKVWRIELIGINSVLIIRCIHYLHYYINVVHLSSVRSPQVYIYLKGGKMVCKCIQVL